MLARGSPISIRVARGSWGLLSSHCRANIPHLGLCSETPCSTPVATGISGLHSRLTQGVCVCVCVCERERDAFVVLKQEALRSEDILERTYFPSFQS